MADPLAIRSPIPAKSSVGDAKRLEVVPAQSIVKTRWIELSMTLGPARFCVPLPRRFPKSAHWHPGLSTRSAFRDDTKHTHNFR